VAKSVNKILAYTAIAILLGSVTMIVPLALLGPNNLVPADSTDNLLGSGEEKLERNGTLACPDATAQQTDGTGTYDISSSESGVGKADAASGLSSIGLMIVPGFLVALGVSVYLKKRMV
jgi:hypothetical protein